MRIAHTKEVRLFREVKGVEQDLVQQIVGTVEEAYLVDIRTRTTNSIKDTVAGVITDLQRQLLSVDAARSPGQGGHLQEDDI